jgi:hypothetical protein
VDRLGYCPWTLQIRDERKQWHFLLFVKRMNRKHIFLPSCFALHLGWVVPNRKCATWVHKLEAHSVKIPHFRDVLLPCTCMVSEPWESEPCPPLAASHVESWVAIEQGRPCPCLSQARSESHGSTTLHWGSWASLLIERVSVCVELEWQLLPFQLLFF